MGTPAVKIGLWGGDGGVYHDITVTPQRLNSVTIRSGLVIDAIAFSYTGTDENVHLAGQWGESGGGVAQIQLGPHEFVRAISGTHGSFRYAGGADVITSLNIVTNVSTHSFGTASGNTFSVPVENGGRIVAFYARAGRYLDAIGVYIRP